MKDGEAIRIRLLSHRTKAWLPLHGTILTYREQVCTRESAREIPLELVTMTEKRRSDGGRLISALLSLMIGPAIGGAWIGMWRLLAGIPPDIVWSISLGTGTIAGVIAFVFLRRRIAARKTVRISHTASIRQ